MRLKEFPLRAAKAQARIPAGAIARLSKNQKQFRLLARGIFTSALANNREEKNKKRFDTYSPNQQL